MTGSGSVTATRKLRPLKSIDIAITGFHTLYKTLPK